MACFPAIAYFSCVRSKVRLLLRVLLLQSEVVRLERVRFVRPGAALSPGIADTPVASITRGRVSAFEGHKDK